MYKSIRILVVEFFTKVEKLRFINFRQKQNWINSLTFGANTIFYGIRHGDNWEWNSRNYGGA